MKIEVVTEKAGWNDFIADCEFGDILQTWEWGEVRRGELWEPHRIQVKDGEKVVGQASILSRQLPLGFTMLYVPRGPVLDYRSDKVQEVLQAILNWAKEFAVQHRALMVKVGPGVGEDQVPGIKEMLDKLGLLPTSHSVQTKHTMIVDLQLTEADIFQSFDKDTRNLVRRAAREGVEVEHYDQADDVKALRTFHNMYLTTATRGTFAARPWSYMSRMWELMAPLGMAHVYVASFEGKPMAASVVLRCGKVAYQLWSGSRRDVEKKYATYALQWTIIQDMKSKGATAYDMWGVAPTDEPNSHAWSGVTMFKKGFSGKRVEYVGDWDLPTSPLYRLYVLADAARMKLLRRG